MEELKKLVLAVGSAIPVINFASPFIATAISAAMVTGCTVRVLSNVDEGKTLVYKIVGRASHSLSPTPSPTPLPFPSPSSTPDPIPIPISIPTPTPSLMINLPPNIIIGISIAGGASIWAIRRVLTRSTPPTLPEYGDDVIKVEVNESIHGFLDSVFSRGEQYSHFTAAGNLLIVDASGVGTRSLRETSDRKERMSNISKNFTCAEFVYKGLRSVDASRDEGIVLLTEPFLCTSLALHFGLAITLDGSRFVLYYRRGALVLEDEQQHDEAKQLEKGHPCGRPQHVYLPIEYLVPIAEY